MFRYIRKLIKFLPPVEQIQTIIIIMAVFDFFKPKQNTSKQFVTEQAFKINLTKQMQMTPQTMGQLGKMNVSPDKELKLEYFFYTNTADKARLFAKEMGKLNYEVKFGQSAGKDKNFLITSWTTKMKMEENVVAGWTKQMCELGYRFDCDFDGWRTSPNQ
ncbi:MAG: ribonuclease E inhibitor RraB [Flavisolibacter sp.]